MSTTVDINISQTLEEVVIIATPTNYVVNIIREEGGSGVSSVNGLTGAVTIPISEENFTTVLKTKLDNIESGAEVNVNADFNATSGDAQILNKPDLTVYVPYTGATQDVNLGEFGLQTGNIEFDLTPTNVPTGVGSMGWNDTAGTLDLKLKGGAVTLQIGQETVARVVNKTATNITLSEANYQAVRVTGAQGQRPKVDLAQANSELNSTTTLGLVTETILNNAEGFITTSGQVQNINTTGSLQGETWADGDILYLSGTVAGRITNIKPIAPIHTVIIGFVEYAHITQGKIFVKVDNGYELDELHNVSAIAPNNNEALVYDTATTLWKPKSLVADAIVDGVTTVAPSQNAVFDALATKQNNLTGTGLVKSTAGVISYDTNSYIKTVIRNTTKSTGINALTTTILNSYLIPANTFSATDFFRIPSLIFTKTGTAGLYQTKLYINNINSISGGTGGQVTSYSPTATQLFSQQSRNFFLRGGQLLGFPISIGSASDITGALPTLSAITFDPTIDNYLITAVALMTVGDLVFQESILITN